MRYELERFIWKVVLELVLLTSYFFRSRHSISKWCTPSFTACGDGLLSWPSSKSETQWDVWLTKRDSFKVAFSTTPKLVILTTMKRVLYRSYLEEGSFLLQILNSFFIDAVTSITARIMGRYYLLNSLIMGHCAFAIHHIPIISLAVLSLTLSIFMHGSEAFYYYTAPVNFYVLFPILVSCKSCLFVRLILPIE